MTDFKLVDTSAGHVGLLPLHGHEHFRGEPRQTSVSVIDRLQIVALCALSANRSQLLI